jgi:short-subunit dehydrogenase
MATALVTGGTSGIGAEFARQLAARGFDLVLVARDIDRLESMAAELHAASGISVEQFPADLADRAEVQRVVERLTDDARPIEYFVNNAGFAVHSSLLAADTTVHETAIDVMIRAVLVLGGAAGRAMRGRGHGSIVNVSSSAGFITMGSYSSIKAWVLSYSQGLAVELRASGVVVTALCPGWVRTEFHGRAGIRTSSIPDSLWLESAPLVRAALRDVDRRRVVSIPTVRYKALMWFARHIPLRTNRWVSGKISGARDEENAQSTHPVAASDPNSSVTSTGQGQ